MSCASCDSMYFINQKFIQNHYILTRKQQDKAKTTTTKKAKKF